MTVCKLVLIVDDETYWLDRTCAAAKACGLEPVTARGFDEATRLLNVQSFPIVITDNNMAGNSNAGLELMQYINARFKDGCPIILQSSEVPTELETILKVFPQSAFVQKDMTGNDSQLVSVIRQILD